MSKKKDKTSPQMIKTIYFDEEAAQDYLDIKNGGRFDWSTDENYNLTDLTKMNLVYYGVRVGAYDKSRLGIDKEFQIGNAERIDANEMFNENAKGNAYLCDVYDIILAGVIQGE